MCTGTETTMLSHLLGFLCLLTVLLAPWGLAAPEPALLGHWKFDEARGDLAEDGSGHGNRAEVLDAQWAKGEFGAALRLAGKGAHARVPQLDGLDGSKELTVEAWVMWEAGGRYPNIITGGRWSPGGFLIFVVDNNCSFRMGRPAPGPGEPEHKWQETGAPLINGFETGKWYHLAATFKQPLITTYLNGKKVASAQWDYPVGYSGDLEIGRWNQTSHQGLIDQVKIYKRALSAEEVQASYTAEAPRRAQAAHVKYEALPALSEPIAAIENKHTKLQIDARGRCVGLIDKRTGDSLLASAAPLLTAAIGGKTLTPASCTFANGLLRVAFGKSEAAAVIECVSKDQYLTFNVKSVEGKPIDSLTFLSLSVQPGKHVSPTSGAVVGEEWGVCLRALNLQTQVSAGGAPPTLKAACISEHGIVGSKAALVVVPDDQLRGALKEMIRAEKLPASELGGPFALDAQELRGSYLFAHPSEKGIERWIEIGKRGGFTHLHFDGWYKTLGHYEPNPTLFPSGLEGMKSMVRKVHAAGLKAGMHTLSGCIQPQDPWVTPVPDKRLAADASYTLAADMNEKSDTIFTHEKPQDHDVIWSYSGRGNAIRIGEEIIQYTAISRSPQYAFLKCKRGAFGTRPGAHRRDSKVDHLRQVYLAFYPDEKSTLVDEVADAIARVYNECEFDQIYMDGAEGMGSSHAIQVMRDAIYKRLKRPAIVEASCWDHWSWYYHSRIGAWDHPKWGLKPFTDLHCASIADYRNGALLQAQLGWWVVLGPSQASRAERPDEMEYFCAKTLGFDAPSSTQGIGSLSSPANARMQEYLTMAGWYERLRLANYFPQAVLEQLRQRGKEFHLVRDDQGQWQLLPTDYLSHKVTSLQNGTQTWTLGNRFQAQPLKMRLEALYSVQPYDSAEAIVIADPASVDGFMVRRAATGVTASLTRSREQARIGEESLRYTATSQRESPKGAWAHAGLSFKPYLNIKQCDALGVWIHGDGKGEVLNLQLTTPREYMRALGEHYVRIDFTGWRYFEIPLRERDAQQHRDYQWPYADLAGIYMTPINRSQIGELNLYLNNLPPNDSATVYLGPIKALPIRRVELANPVIDLNGEKFQVPVKLRSGDYIELDGNGECRVFDERGALLERLDLKAPVLKAGRNQLTFTCEGPTDVEARAELTVTTHGPALQERTPAEKVNWALLGDEYEIPRLITKLDGKDNAWQVICRKDARAELGVEMDVEQIAAGERLKHLQLAIGSQRLVLPVELAVGDRVVLEGKTGRVYRKSGGAMETFNLAGDPLTLQGGIYPVVLSFASTLHPEFRVAVSLVKHYK